MEMTTTTKIWSFSTLNEVCVWLCVCEWFHVFSIIIIIIIIIVIIIIYVFCVKCNSGLFLLSCVCVCVSLKKDLSYFSPSSSLFVRRIKMWKKFLKMFENFSFVFCCFKKLNNNKNKSVEFNLFFVCVCSYNLIIVF